MIHWRNPYVARSLFRRRYRYSFKYRYLLKRAYIFFIDCTEQSAIEGFDDHGFGVFSVVVHLSAIAVDHAVMLMFAL